MAGEHPEKLENIENQEVKNYFDLDYLNSEQFEMFKARVYEWNGLVRVFIHSTYFVFDEKGREQKQSEVLIKLLKLSESAAPPIIIMEDKGWLQILRGTLDTIAEHVKNKPYLMETLDNYSYPVIDGAEQFDGKRGDFAKPGTETYTQERAYIIQSMTALSDMLKAAGVTKILVGGNNLTFNQEKGIWEECVGNFIRNIKEFGKGDIEVDVSEATIPLSGKDYRAIKRNQAEK